MTEKEMKPNNKITMKDILTNRKYRARAILAFYAVLFLVLIVSFRTEGTKPTNNKNNKEITNNGKDKNNKEEEIFGGFELIAEKNFNFKYTLIIDEDEITSIGKRYNNKEQFVMMKNSDEKFDFLVEGDIVKAKDESSIAHNEYNIASKPYINIDYFDISIINKILNKARRISEKELSITNKELCLIVNCVSIKEEGLNTIELDIKNNNIVGIKIDWLALITSIRIDSAVNEEFKKATIILSYEDFNLVEDFDINYE